MSLNTEDIVSILAITVAIFGFCLIAAFAVGDVLIDEGEYVLAILGSFSFGALWCVSSRRVVKYTHGEGAEQ